MSKPGGASHTLVLGVLASGRGSNLQALIDAIEAGRLPARIAVVLSNKKEAQALERARKHSINGIFIDPKNYESREAYDEAIYRDLKDHRVGLLVLAGYMRLLTPSLVAPFRGRIINIHPSLLPAFPGLNAQRQALAYGVKISGCTVHFVDEQMDHGPIIAQAAVPALQDDTELTLTDRILVEEHRLLVDVVQRFAEGRLAIRGRVVETASPPCTEVIP